MSSSGYWTGATVDVFLKDRTVLLNSTSVLFDGVEEWLIRIGAGRRMRLTRKTRRAIRSTSAKTPTPTATPMTVEAVDAAVPWTHCDVPGPV